jgi:hypothetical protein
MNALAAPAPSRSTDAGVPPTASRPTVSRDRRPPRWRAAGNVIRWLQSCAAPTPRASY